MLDECKQSTTASRTHVKKNFQVITFHDGLKAWIDSYRHCVCPWSYLKHTFSIIYRAKYDNRIGKSRRRSWRYLICMITLGLCSYNVRLFDDVTAIWVSYWWRREFPNYEGLHRGRICKHAQLWCFPVCYDEWAIWTTLGLPVRRHEAKVNGAKQLKTSAVTPA